MPKSRDIKIGGVLFRRSPSYLWLMGRIARSEGYGSKALLIQRNDPKHRFLLLYTSLLERAGVENLVWKTSFYQVLL